MLWKTKSNVHHCLQGARVDVQTRCKLKVESASGKVMTQKSQGVVTPCNLLMIKKSLAVLWSCARQHAHGTWKVGQWKCRSMRDNASAFSVEIHTCFRDGDLSMCVRLDLIPYCNHSSAAIIPQPSFLKIYGRHRMPMPPLENQCKDIRTYVQMSTARC